MVLILTLRVWLPVWRSGFLVLTGDKGPYEAGVEWPMILIGVIAAILLAAGLLPPYREIWKRNGRVVGISRKLASFMTARL